MSPEARTSLARMARLRAELEADRAAMERALNDVRTVLDGWEVDAPDRPLLAFGALGVHGWFGALESALERIVRTVDGSVPTGERWHRELLSQASVSIPSLRPPVLDRDLLPELLRILEFRQFLRHAYGVELDPSRLRESLVRVRASHLAMERALDDFDEYLEQVVEGLRGGAREN